MNLIFFFLSLFGFTNKVQAYIEGPVVRYKFYPLEKRINLSATGGMLFSQSYIDTQHLGLSLGYHLTDHHLLKVAGSIFKSKDRNERRCVESFFSDPEAAGGDGAPGPCDPNMEFESEGNFLKRPAYVPIRQYNYLFSLDYEFTPVYGKSIWLRGPISYLDLFFNVGLGLVQNTYWPLKTKTNSGRDILQEGAASNEETGLSGRPESVELMSPFMSLGFGNRFYLFKIFALTIELKNFSTFSFDKESQFDPILTALSMGVSVLI